MLRKILKIFLAVFLNILKMLMYLATKNRGKEYAPLERVSWFVVSNLRKGVCALSHGIAPNVVMNRWRTERKAKRACISEVRITENGAAVNWTGHSDYKAIKLYIDIVDSIRTKEMTKMDCHIRILSHTGDFILLSPSYLPAFPSFLFPKTKLDNRWLANFNSLLIR